MKRNLALLVTTSPPAIAAAHAKTPDIKLKTGKKGVDLAPISLLASSIGGANVPRPAMTMRTP